MALGTGGAGGTPGPGEPALSADAILEGIDQGQIKALVLVENDPFWSFSDEERLAWALDKLELLVVLDYLPSPTVTAGARGSPHPPAVRADGRPASSTRRAGPQVAPPVHLGGTPMALISPDVHPPRTFLTTSPGASPGPRRRFFRS